MSASRHLSPHEFGPVHAWLESDEGHDWQTRSFGRSIENYGGSEQRQISLGMYSLRSTAVDQIEVGQPSEEGGRIYNDEPYPTHDSYREVPSKATRNVLKGGREYDYERFSSPPSYWGRD